MDRLRNGDWPCLAALDSPALTFPPPRLIRPGLIPPAARAVLQRHWRQPALPAGKVAFYRLREVFVVGEGLVFDRRPQLLAPGEDLITAEQAQAAAEELQREATTGQMPGLAGPAVLCKGPGGASFNVWLIDLLGRAFWAQRTLGAEAAIYLVPAGTPWQTMLIRDSLALAGIPLNRVAHIDNAPLFVEELIVVEGLTRGRGFVSPLVLACLEVLRGSVRGDGNEKIAVLHEDGKPRFTKEPQLRGLLRRSSYRILPPGRRPLAGQIGCIRDARQVFGAAGPALAVIGFLAPSAQVIAATAAASADPRLWLLAGLSGLDYTEIRCPTAPPPSESPLAELLVVPLKELQEAGVVGDWPAGPAGPPSSSP